MVSIIPRSAWTSTGNGRAGRDLDRGRVDGLTIHYPAAGNVSLNGLSREKVAERLRQYRDGHVRGNGWADIGYNYAIDGSGRVWFLTGNNVGAHANTVGNTTTVGVLFVIGNTEQPTDAAIEAFKDLRAHLLKTYPRATKVRGHQQVPGNATACPGGPLMAAIKAGRFTAPAAPARPKVVDNRPAVSLARLKRASRSAPWSRIPGKAARRDRDRVKKALKAEGVRNYRRWQLKLGYTGKDADGVPGEQSLTRLGDKHGFRVIP